MEPTNELTLRPAAYERWHWIIAILLLLFLVLLWFAGYGPSSGSCCGAPVPVAAVPAAPQTMAPAAPATEAQGAAPATDAPAAAPPADEIPTVVKFHFAVDRADLPAGAGDSLSPVVTYLSAHGNAKAVISGYHDATGNQAHNDELAKNRAKSVRAALIAAGVPEDRIVLEKPRETTGSGDLAEARRVEVSVH